MSQANTVKSLSYSKSPSAEIVGQMWNYTGIKVKPDNIVKYTVNYVRILHMVQHSDNVLFHLQTCLMFTIIALVCDSTCGFEW